VNSRQTRNDCNRRLTPLAAALRVWTASAVLGMGLAGRAGGQEPAAQILLPMPSAAGSNGPTFATPAAAEAPIEKDPADEPPPKPRPPDFKYPPTYSETKKKDSFFENLRQKLFGGDAKKEDAKKGDKKETPAAAKEPVPVPDHPFTPPAWKWYGYGAPVPGLNPLAPQGTYPPIHPYWYVQTHSTPGAVPSLPPFYFMPGAPVPHQAPPGPVLPYPEPLLKPGAALSPAEVPIIPSRPAEIDLPATGPTQEPPQLNQTPPAKIDLPINSNSSESSAMPLLPLTSAVHTGQVVRAQALDPGAVPAALTTSLQSACIGLVSNIELSPRGPRKIGLRLTLMPGAQADRLADRISKIPELAGYQVEIEFAR